MITSSLKEKGLRVVGGTTLIKEQKVTTNCKKEDAEKHRFVQTVICPTMHRNLRILAAEQEITLAKAIENVIEAYFDKEV